MKWDFEQEDTEHYKIPRQKLKALEHWITKHYGKPCKAFATQCSCCRIWLAFNNLKVNL